MAKPLTPITIATLKARPRRYEVSDGGCAGLRIVIFPSRRKSFILRYRFRGLPRKLTLGSVAVGGAEPEAGPELDTPLSLAAARELATKALRQAKSGSDPAAAKQRQRQEQLAAESDTLQAIAQEYLRREGGRLRTIRQRRSDLELLCASPIGRLPLAEVRRAAFVRVLDHIADNNGPVRADRVLSATKTLLSWHADRSDYVGVLGRGGRRTSIRERARSRVLSDDELRRVWTTSETYPGPFGAFVRFTLLTATRRSESAGLRRSELSDDGEKWTIPAARYKSKRDTLIPLSEAAQRIVAAQPVLGDYVFSVTGQRALGGFTERKREFDKACGVGSYRLHDLRRTSRTLLSRAGVNADIGERCLGHAMVGVRGTYDRFGYASEKLAAFEALAALIGRVVHAPEAEVANLAAARGKRRRP